MDIMDGHFVPNLTFGPPVIASLRQAQKDASYFVNLCFLDVTTSLFWGALLHHGSRNCGYQLYFIYFSILIFLIFISLFFLVFSYQITQAFIDCHLMVTKPADWVGPLAKAGANLFTFHLESDLPEGGVTAMIEQVKAAGMKAGIVIKPATPVEELFPYLDQLDHVLIMTVNPGFSGQSFMADQMPKVKALREKAPTLNIQVDGGLSPKTIDAAAEAGANVIVAASAIFGSEDRQGVINSLRAGVDKNLK